MLLELSRLAATSRRPPVGRASPPFKLRGRCGASIFRCGALGMPPNSQACAHSILLANPTFTEFFFDFSKKLLRSETRDSGVQDGRRADAAERKPEVSRRGRAAPAGNRDSAMPVDLRVASDPHTGCLDAGRADRTPSCCLCCFQHGEHDKSAARLLLPRHVDPVACLCAGHAPSTGEPRAAAAKPALAGTVGGGPFKGGATLERRDEAGAQHTEGDLRDPAGSAASAIRSMRELIAGGR